MTVTPSVDAFLNDQPDPLIKSGHYQIVPVGADKAKAHTRITNFAKKLEDEFNLTMWKQRMVLLGTAQRSDIAIAALAANDDKRELDRLAEAAMEAARANVASETGSALHPICERVDAGETLELPKDIRADVDAYQLCLGVVDAAVELIEQVVVVPKLGLAGRFDRIVTIDDTAFIADLKTGRDLSYSWGSISVQLALYAAAETIYKPETKTHTPMPEVDQSRGLVLHLPAGQATCTPYWVNLEAGREGIRLISTVLEWRKAAKGLATTVVNPRFTARSELRGYVSERCRYIITNNLGAELARAWPDDVATLKASDSHSEVELDLILDACDTIEARHQLPFPECVDPRDRVGRF